MDILLWTVNHNLYRFVIVLFIYISDSWHVSLICRIIICLSSSGKNQAHYFKQNLEKLGDMTWWLILGQETIYFKDC